MKKEKNLYIAIIRFGEDKLEKGVFFADLKKHLKSTGYDVEESYLIRLYSDAYDHTDSSNDSGHRWTDKIKHNVRCVPSSESYFRLLEYKELKEARESSTKAYRLAFAAMVISGVLALTSVGFQILNEIKDNTLLSDYSNPSIPPKSGSN